MPSEAFQQCLCQQLSDQQRLFLDVGVLSSKVILCMTTAEVMCIAIAGNSGVTQPGVKPKVPLF